jgi:parallel beta-helix repeat protein
MKPLLLVIALLALAPGVIAECEAAFDLMQITKDTTLCNKAYDVPSGITIRTDNVVLDCNGAIIRGTAVQDGQGIIIDNADSVTVKNCNILNYDVGIYVKDANRNTIIQNALLKNKIGVRMLNAHENRFEDNADKSLLKPVSAIASKFNSFHITNKDLDKDFCETNLCNQPGPMSPCENDDLYCSPDCNYQSDNDCPKPNAEPEALPWMNVQTSQPSAPPAAKPAETQKPAQAAPKATTNIISKLPPKIQFWATALLFIIAYLVGFLSFQHVKYKHSRN